MESLRCSPLLLAAVIDARPRADRGDWGPILARPREPRRDGGGGMDNVSSSRSDPILELLRSTRTVAVVGCSPRPDRDSHRVAAYLQGAGYRIVPVNPAHRAILGERCYPDVAAVPAEVEVDVVDVFRRPEGVPEVVEQAIARGVRGIWLQLGVGHPGAEARARAAGLVVVSERCLKVEHAVRRAALEGRG